MATRRLVSANEVIDVDEGTAAALLNTGKWQEPGGSGGFAILNELGTDRILQRADSRRYMRFSNSSAINVTIPPQSSVPWDAGVEIIIEQAGAGQVTVVAGSGVTIRNKTGMSLKTAGQYAVVTLKRVAEDEWVMAGDREAA